MNELLQAATAFPTVVYTVMLGIALVYWIFVILGALDIDVLGGETELGDFGDVGDVGDVGDAGNGMPTGVEGSGGGLAGALSALGLRKVPVTVAVTAVLLVGWVLCLLSMRYLGFVSGGPVLTWVIGPGVFVAALIIATMVAAVLVRPLAPVFHTHTAKSRSDYIGSICEIRTGRVDADFGQAEIDDGGTVLVIPVRCDKTGARLVRGSHALVIEYDDTRQAYLVEPYENVLGDKSGS